MQKNSQKGFTLIELLIVVGMVGVIIAISIIGYKDVRRAEGTTYQSEVRTKDLATVNGKAEVKVFEGAFTAVTDSAEFEMPGLFRVAFERVESNGNSSALLSGLTTDSGIHAGDILDVRQVEYHHTAAGANSLVLLVALKQ